MYSDLLRRAILDSGLSHRELARRAAVDPNSVGRFVRGKTSLHLDAADRLGAVVGVTVSDRPADPDTDRQPRDTSPAVPPWAGAACPNCGQAHREPCPLPDGY